MSDADYKLPARGTWFFWLAFVAGWAVTGFGLWTMFNNVAQNNPRYSFELGLGFNVFHDAVIAPLACAVGYVVSRFVPKRVRLQVCWGLFTSAIVVAIGYAPLRGLGRKPDNPTIEPLNYATSVLTVLAVVWIIVALLVVLPYVRRPPKGADLDAQDHVAP